MTSSGTMRVSFVRRFFETLIAIFILLTLTFFFLRLMPGGPFDEEIPLNPQVKSALIQYWAMDKGLFSQLCHYIGNFLSGDFGVSMVNPSKRVSDIIKVCFSQTVWLNSLAIVAVYVVSFLTSFLRVLRPDSLLCRFIDVVNVAAISAPSLFVGPVLIYIFGFYLEWFPTAFLTTPVHFILPLVTLCFRPWGQLNLMLVNSLREAMAKDYIRTARAKGLSEGRILWNHAYKNSLLPILSMSGPLVVSLISGSFLVEILFSIPGLGRQFVESLNLRDYPVIMALVLLYGAALITLTQICDVLAGYLDPRLREQR